MQKGRTNIVLFAGNIAETARMQDGPGQASGSGWEEPGKAKQTQGENEGNAFVVRPS
jgi:hypothetical protein